MKTFNTIGKLCMAFVLFISGSCNDFVNVDEPIKELSAGTIFEDEGTATGAVLGLYLRVWNFGYNVSLATGLASDEFINLSTNVNQEQLYENEILPNNYFTTDLWNILYQLVAWSNNILEGLEAPSALSSELKMQLKGETLFMRAYAYLHLVKFFGDVPLVTTTDYRVSSTLPRNDGDQVYALIISDLQQAQQLLSEEYVTIERVRVNKSCATALLARAYLYSSEWTLAEAEATKVIDNSVYSLKNELNEVFLANSSETILQFYPATTGTMNTYEGLYYLPLFGSFTLSRTLVGQGLVTSFEPGDLRREKWLGSVVQEGVTYYYPFKYKILSNAQKLEYSSALRLSEQYLVRAEARTMSGNISAAQEDLNIIRNRAGLPATMANDQPSMLNAILSERRIELFGEWGHRWFDLQRTNLADATLGSKPGWQSTDTVFPIPEKEILTNPNMTQNQGY